MELELVVDSYYDVQALRININNRIGSLERRAKQEKDESEKNALVAEAVFLRGFAKAMGLKAGEKYCEKEMRGIVKDEPIWKAFLEGVKGIGPVMAGGLISIIDITKAPHVSSVWKYFGLDVRGGRAPRREKGKKSDWNDTARVLAYKIAGQLLKAKGDLYPGIYYREKERLESRGMSNACAFPEQRESCLERQAGAAKRLGRKAKAAPCKLHIHRAACRKMVKIFLSHLWESWRKLEGLPVTEPYAIARLAHEHKIDAA